MPDWFYRSTIILWDSLPTQLREYSTSYGAGRSIYCIKSLNMSGFKIFNDESTFSSINFYGIFNYS